MSEVTGIVAIVSGGLDSTTLAYRLRDKYPDARLTLLSFDYGQRHNKELEYAAKSAKFLNAEHHVLDLGVVTKLFSESGSSLVSDSEVPDGHYAWETMKQTVVPNRNMMMLAIAGGVAVAQEAQLIATGVHAGDHFIYPDCRPDFIATLSSALYLGNEDFGDLQTDCIYAPYLHSTKADIALEAMALGVPFNATWSCYKGGEIHCGRCGTCVERQEAIDEASINYQEIYDVKFIDNTEYEDASYWKEVTL